MANKFTYTTQSQVRAAFWDAHPDLTPARTVRGRILPQNSQPTTTRCLFVDYVDGLHRDGQISDRLAQSVTL